MNAVRIEHIREAANTIRPYAVRTPLLTSDRLNQKLGFRLWIKAEVLQRSGSFKFRGACNAVMKLPDDGRPVLAFSTGNHAQAIALTAQLRNRKATVIMPDDAPEEKKQATTSYGASLVLFNRRLEDREEIGRIIQQEQNAHLIPPFDDVRVIAGQGTTGLEISEQLIEYGITSPAQVIICCGGGGLISGCAIALKTYFPHTDIFAAEPEGFDDMKRSLESGEIQSIDVNNQSICDAILTRAPGQITFPIAKSLVSGGYVVTDEEALRAMQCAQRYFHLVVEPGGAVALAAALALTNCTKNSISSSRSSSVNSGIRTGVRDGINTDSDVVVVLSGGNVDTNLYLRALSQQHI